MADEMSWRQRYGLVAIARRMGLSQKLLAFCISFTVPTAVLLYYYTESVNETIRFARKEQCGLRYNQPLRGLMRLSQELPRNLATASAAIDQHFKELAGAEQSRCVSGTAQEELETGTRYQELLRTWQGLQGNPDADVARALNEGLLALFTHVGDTSNLILDPDLDTYYVMDLLLIRFPESLGLLAEAGTGNPAGAISGLRRHREAVEHNMRVGFDRNDYYPGSRGTLKAALDPALQAYLKSLGELSSVLQRSDASPQAIAVARDQVRGALYPLYDSAAGWETFALDARAGNRELWKYLTIALITILLLISGAFALVLGRETVRRAQDLEQQTRQLQLIRAVAEAANEATAPADVLRIALDRVCAHMSWPVGHAWLLAGDGDGELESGGIWHLDEPVQRFARFREVSQSTRFKPGVGLPGRVLEAGGPIWVSDVMSDPNFPRARVAEDIGVRAGFAFPILVGKEVVGVLEFFATEPLAPDRPLLETMASVGTHLGRVVERQRAAAALADRETRALSAEKLVRDVTDNAPGFFFQLAIDANGKRSYRFISQGIERISGYSAEEVIADTGLVFSITDPEHQGAIRAAWAESRRTQMPYRVEYRIRTKGGEHRWLRGAGRPSPKPDGSVLWNGFTIDVTAEKEMEQRLADAEQRMRDVIENLPGVVYQLRVEPDGMFHYDYVSSRNIDVWGVPREASLQDALTVHKLVVPEDRERTRQEWADAMRTMTPLSTEFRINRPDGQLRWLRSNATPRPAGDGRVILNGHTLDITETKEAESRVQLAEQRLREFTEGLPGLVYQLEIAWGKPIRYNYLTDHTLQLYGLPREEVLKDPDRLNAMFDPRDMPRIFKQFQESLRTLTPISADFRVKRADTGEIRWLRTYSIPRKAESGGILINGFTMDASAEKEAEEKIAAAERLLREVTDSIPGIVYQMRRTPKGEVKFNFISGAVERLAGVSQQKARDDFSAVMGAMFPEDQLAVAQAIQRSAQTLEPTPIGWRVRTPEGSVRWMHSSASLRKDTDGSIIWNGFAADITQLKAYEEELGKAKEAAETANRAKSDFLANMSHEIRTPMNAIIGLSQLALHLPLPPREYGYLDKIHRAARSLLGIINDILDFSKIEAGKLALEQTPFRLRDALENVNSLIGMKAGEKDLEYSCTLAPDTPSALIGDPLRLGQVLLNLAGNAVKFTDKGQVSVRVVEEGSQDGETTLHFTVQDSGIGIAPEQATRLFESFYQADASTTRRYGGTGLGLSISRRLVEAMGGRIWAESVPGQGSTFHFTARFGRATQDQIDALPVAEGVQRLDGTRLLVVEDNETNQIIAREILEEAGAAVTIADNGRKAVTAVEHGDFDAVLMDVHMPVMDGHEATRLIRNDPRFADLPIIAMTASATIQDRERCLEAGMNAHVSKPIDLAELFGTLRRFVRGNGAAAAPGTTPPAQESVGTAIDFAAGMRRLGGRREAFDNLLRVFASSTPDPVPGIKDALAQGHAQEAAQLAHRLRGAAGSIAANALAAVATDLEKTLKTGGSVDGLLPVLGQRWQEVRGELDRLLALAAPPARAAPADPAELHRGLLRLDLLLSSDDAEAVTVLRHLRAAFAHSATTARFAELEKRVASYDFPAARQALQALRQDLGLTST